MINTKTSDCLTFNWCDGSHHLEDNSWFELGDGRVQCDHSVRPQIEQLPGLDIALSVSEYRDSKGISFGEPEIFVYSPGFSVNPYFIKLLLQELTELVSLANHAVSDQVDHEQCS